MSHETQVLASLLNRAKFEQNTRYRIVTHELGHGWELYPETEPFEYSIDATQHAFDYLDCPWAIIDDNGEPVTIGDVHGVCLRDIDDNEPDNAPNFVSGSPTSNPSTSRQAIAKALAIVSNHYDNERERHERDTAELMKLRSAIDTLERILAQRGVANNAISPGTDTLCELMDVALFG